MNELLFSLEVSKSFHQLFSSFFACKQLGNKQQRKWENLQWKLRGGERSGKEKGKKFLPVEEFFFQKGSWRSRAENVIVEKKYIFTAILKAF